MWLTSRRSEVQHSHLQAAAKWSPVCATNEWIIPTFKLDDRCLNWIFSQSLWTFQYTKTCAIAQLQAAAPCYASSIHEILREFVDTTSSTRRRYIDIYMFARQYVSIENWMEVATSWNILRPLKQVNTKYQNSKYLPTASKKIMCQLQSIMQQVRENDIFFNAFSLPQTGCPLAYKLKLVLPKSFLVVKFTISLQFW